MDVQAVLMGELGWAQSADTAGLLAGFMAGPAGIVQTLADLFTDSASGPGWSQICDVTRCPTDGLPWLAQFVGVRLPPGMPDAQARAAVQAESGWKRGTAAAIVAAAQQYVASGYTVVLAERTPDPYSFTLTIPAAGVSGTYAALDAGFSTYTALDASQTSYAGFTSSGGEGAISAAVLASKPAGLLMHINYT